MNNLLEVSDHLRLSYPIHALKKKNSSCHLCVYIFLVSFHLSSGFCGVTFVPWPQGFIRGSSLDGSAFPSQTADLP